MWQTEFLKRLKMTATEHLNPTDVAEVKKLSERDRDIYLEMLDADDEPYENLVSAFKARHALIAE